MTPVRPAPPVLDWLVLTAANKAQARGYRAQLAARQADGRLSVCRHWLVVPDPGDRRVGSGGSTLVVLATLVKRLSRSKPKAHGIANLFAGQRILIIHSGGDSRRLPAYAAEGKVFTPVPRDTPDAQPAAMFDLILSDLAGIPIPEEGRVVIATGDVLLGVGRHRPAIDMSGMTGVAFPGSLETGSRHGVYIRGRTGRVSDFLQKPDAATARQRKAIDSRGRVLIDTGILALDPPTVESWLASSGVSRGSAPRGLLAAVLQGRAGCLDLYAHILRAAGSPQRSRAALATYTPADTPPSAAPDVHRLYLQANRTRFSVTTVPECDFLHIGSSAELLALVGNRSALSGAVRAVTVFNSRVAARLKAARPAIVESCLIDRSTTLAGRNILVGFPGGHSLRLPRGIGMVFLPVGRSDWSCIVFGATDDFKTSWQAGGTIANQELDALLSRTGIAPRRLFDAGSDDTLWTARLWTVGPLADMLRRAMWLAKPAGRPPRDWISSQRVSLKELITRVNHDRIIAHRGHLSSQVRLQNSVGTLSHGRPVPLATIRSLINHPLQAQSVLQAIERGLLTRPPAFHSARLFQAAADIAKRFPRVTRPIAGVHPCGLESAAFACIAEGVAQDSPIPTRPPRAAIHPGQTVRVTSPVRIDLAGGWSDTPPICHEMGGAVVNAAVALENRHPICVSASITRELRIRITSTDLNQSITIGSARDTANYADLRDWAALPKAALTLAGIVPFTPAQSLAQRLARFGGGLNLTMHASLPKGSGLGTSSILGAAVLACLDRVCGRGPNLASLMKRTSLLEQMMSTAGGWQDQAGGITPGIKLVSTSRGPNQTPRIAPILVPTRALDSLRLRALLYYTGQKRLARDILRTVVGRYLSGDSAVTEIIHRLKATASIMAADLARGDIDAFARGVTRNWDLKKAIDPGSTNANIESILAPLIPHLSGYELAGAGGGGFIFMIARDAAAATRIRRSLARAQHRPHARLYDFDIDEQGLTVSVE